MRVDLRRGEIRVSEPLLHGPQVSPALQQMSSVGVPERVWVYTPPVGHGMSFQDAPGVTRRELAAPPIQEDRLGGDVRGDEGGTPVPEIGAQRLRRWPAERDSPHLGALPE